MLKAVRGDLSPSFAFANSLLTCFLLFLRINTLLYCPDYSVITCTAAQIAGMAFTNLFPGYFLAFMLLHEGSGGHDKAGSTETALNTAGIQVGLLDRGQLTFFTFTLSGSYIAAIRPDSKVETGVDGNVIDQYGTGPAFANSTTLLNTGVSMFS